MDSTAFGAAEQFIEGTIAAALVALWLLAVALHLGIALIKQQRLDKRVAKANVHQPPLVERDH